MRSRKYLMALGAVVITFGLIGTLVSASGKTLTPVTLSIGDSITISCSTGKIKTDAAQAGNTTLRCLGAPTIQSVSGVSEGGTVKGKIGVQAIVVEGASPIANVIFELQQNGKRVDSWTEAVVPYYYKGQANGWDTTTSPDGSYTLQVVATDKDNLSNVKKINFKVGNTVVVPTATPVPTNAPTIAPTVTTGPTAIPTLTLAPTATPVPPTTPHDHDTGAVGVCGEPENYWHPPVVTTAAGVPCNTGHEHGDAPPTWIATAGYQLEYHGHFNTSAVEATLKHAAMKGFTARFNDTDIYFRVHAASNPLDRSARFHSYEVWARDPKGGVSHWQGWYNSGDPVTDRFVRRKGIETAVRPVILVVDETSASQGINCEQWYANTADWSWDFGWTICNTTTLFTPGENATASNQATWKLTGDMGGTRRLEAAWYTFRQHPTGKFYSTQFGEIVNGPTDARCSGTSVKYGVSYTNVCLEQTIAPTMGQVAFPGNAVQKVFDTRGVKAPN